VKQVYLSGPLTHAEDFSWWDQATGALDDLGLRAVDPRTFGFNGKEDPPAEIMKADLDMIGTCHAIMVHAHVPSWGAAMELFYARDTLLLPAVAIVNSMTLSAWLRKDTATFTSIEEAAVYIAGALFEGEPK